MSHANLHAVAEVGGTAFVPFKADRPWPAPHPTVAAGNWRGLEDDVHLFAYQRDTFLSRYHKRSNVETTFSMIKRKFGDSLRSKSDVGQMNEVLCKVIAHNLCVLIACIHKALSSGEVRGPPQAGWSRAVPGPSWYRRMTAARISCSRASTWRWRSVSAASSSSMTAREPATSKADVRSTSAIS